MMKLTFNPLQIIDIPKIIPIENQSFKEPWSKDGFKELISNPSFMSVGIFLDQKLVGYVFFYVVMDELHVINVAVDPAFRKKGLGEILLNKVHEHGKKHSVKYAYLEVRETNEAALKLYAKLGYHKQGRRIGYYSNKEDALLMFKDLT